MRLLACFGIDVEHLATAIPTHSGAWISSPFAGFDGLLDCDQMTCGNAFEQLRPFPRTRHPDLIAVIEADVIHSIPCRLVGRREVRLVVLDPEIEAALILGDAGKRGLVGAHAVEHLDAARRVDERLGASRAVGVGFGAVALADVVNEVDRAVALVGETAPRLHHRVDRAIVVLADLVAGDERVDDQDVDRARSAAP
jgi:hypothetical protein